MDRQSFQGWRGYTLLRSQGKSRSACPNIIGHAKENETGRTHRHGILGEYPLIHAASSRRSARCDCARRFRRVVTGGFSGIAIAAAAALLNACASSPLVDADTASPTRADSVTKTDAVAQAKPPKSRTASASGAAKAAAPPKPPEPRLTPDKTVYFAPSSVDLSAEGMQTVRSFAERLKGNRRLVVTLIGSTDGLGSNEMCVAIANKRNSAVEDKLLDLGVKRQQIRKYARGCEVVTDLSCTSDSCRKQYRRVELQIENS